MGKKNRKKQSENQTAKPKKIVYVDRPFAGINKELDLVAMREVIASASMPVRTTKQYGAQDLLLVTLLPDGVPALRREDGVLLVALQTRLHSGDASRDVAYAIEEAIDLEPGQVITLSSLPEPGVRLQEIVDWSINPEITVHENLTFWVTDEEAKKPETKEALENLQNEMVPCAAVPKVVGAYWCSMTKEFVRFARPEEENAVLDGLARLQAKRTLQVAPDSKFLGAFRSCGVLMPVWELPTGMTAEALSEPMAKFAEELTKAIADTTMLSAEERRAKAGIVSRQVTLR